jgi:hypothetical protein
VVSLSVVLLLTSDSTPWEIASLPPPQPISPDLNPQSQIAEPLIEYASEPVPRTWLALRLALGNSSPEEVFKEKWFPKHPDHGERQ